MKKLRDSRLLTAALRRGCKGLLVIAVLAFGAQPLSAGPNAEELAERYTAWILDEIPQYRDHRKTRALAGCVDWNSATPGYLSVKNLVWYYLNPTLGGYSMLPSQLMNQAMALCARRRADDATCICERIAKDNDTVLEIPSAVMTRLARTPATTTKQTTAASNGTGFIRGSMLRSLDLARLQPHGDEPLVPATNVSLSTDAVFVVLDWHRGKGASKGHAVRYRLVDPKGQTRHQQDVRIYPSLVARSWHRFPIKNQIERSGLWHVAIDVDGWPVAKRPLPIQAQP